MGWAKGNQGGHSVFWGVLIFLLTSLFSLHVHGSVQGQPPFETSHPRVC